MARLWSPDRAMAYTLYSTPEGGFVHALDTVHRTARCFDLPQGTISGSGGLRWTSGGTSLAILSDRGSPLMTMDPASGRTRAAAAAAPAPAASPAVEPRSGSDSPMIAAIALAVMAAAVLLIAIGRRHRQATS
jgi:hypothetical protein